jgi:hypothetical protein
VHRDLWKLEFNRRVATADTEVDGLGRSVGGAGAKEYRPKGCSSTSHDVEAVLLMLTPRRSGQESLDQAVKEFLQATPTRPPAPVPVPQATAAPARSGDRPRPAPAPEESDALLAAYDGVLKREAEKAAGVTEAPRPLWLRLLMPTALLLLVAASAYVWLGQPQWLAPPPHVALTPPATPVTGQRQLVAIALEIDDFRRTTGHLPRDLAELGLNVPHISFTALPDMRFELRLGTGPRSLYYLGGSATEPRIQPGGTP